MNNARIIDMGVEETIVGVAQAFSAPVVKLIETMRAAIGAVFEPRYIVKKAEAEASAIDALGGALRRNPEASVHLEINGLTISNLDPQSIEYRALARDVSSKIKKQKNLETIANYAAEELDKKGTVSPESVDPDWTTRFIGIAEDVSDENMQRIWAKILAGEVEQPNSYSKRTLEVVKNLTQREAILFQRVAPSIVRDGPIYYLFDCHEMEGGEIGPNFDHILALSEALLVNSECVYVTYKLGPERYVFLRNDEYAARVRVKGGVGFKKEMLFHAYKLTNAGKELLNILNFENDCKLFKVILRDISKNARNADVSMHKILSSDEKRIITCSEKDLLKEGE